MPAMDVLDATAFAACTRAPPLDDDEIHVWSVDVDAALGPRQIGAAAQAALMRFLCAYADCAQPPRIERGVHGKPFAPALPGLHFNLSHAGPHLLFGFTRGQELGVDLERYDRRVAVDDLAKRFFAASEAQVISGLPAARRQETFLQLWTCKEAVLKAIGQGINFGLDRAEFSLDPRGAVGVLAQIASEAGMVADWIVCRMEPGPGLTGALAWRGGPRRVRTFKLVS